MKIRIYKKLAHVYKLAPKYDNDKELENIVFLEEKYISNFNLILGLGPMYVTDIQSNLYACFVVYDL